MPRIHHVFQAILLSVLIVGLVPLKAQAQSYVFGAASYAIAGPGPMIEADFNGDGVPDLAVLGYSNGMTQVISIFLGTTNGTFAPRVDYPLELNGGPIGATDFTVGDFRGDGKLDIVLVSNSDYYAASIMLGNGDGTFQAPVPLNQTIGSTYTTVASADFNGDGKLDLVFVANNSGTGATMLVLFGNGDGTFQTPVSYQTGGGYLVIGDFNGDGFPDIALGSGVYLSDPATSQISVYMNNGSGAFLTPVNYTFSGEIGESSMPLAVADLNGDGIPDLMVSTGGSAATVYTLLGIGGGAFATPISYTNSLLSIYGGSIAVADFNGDGKLDLALTNHTTPDNGIDILLGNGNGTFQTPPLVYGGGLGPEAILPWDASGTGKPGLAVIGSSYSSYFLTIFTNEGNGSFPQPATYPAVKYPWTAVGGDFTGDGTTDVAVASITTTSSGQDNGGVISVFPGNGDGTFKPRVDNDTTTYPEVIAPGDFNGDGILDLLVVEASSTGESLATWLGNGDGTFQNNISQTLNSYARSVAVTDFNGDGILDVAATLDNVGGIDVFLGTGGGVFATPQFYSSGESLNYPGYKLASADFNGDGHPDLAVTTDSGISILLGNANGTFQPYSAILPGESLLAIGDFNGDGIPDLVLASVTPFVTVALGDGKGDFNEAASFQIPEGVGTGSPVVGDFNGDGKLDIAFTSDLDNVTILFGNGDGTFSYPLEISTAQVPALVAADFNGDGVLDLAMTDVTNQQLDVLLNQPVAALEPPRANFGLQGLGTTSTALPVYLSNPSPVPLDLASIMTTGNFSQTNNCPRMLGRNASCTVNVTFTPVASGAASGSLVFTDDSSGVAENTQMVSLGGTGVVFTAGPNPPVVSPPPSNPQPGEPTPLGGKGSPIGVGLGRPLHSPMTAASPLSASTTITAAPAARFSSSSLAFFAQAVGTSGTSQTVTLNNFSEAPLPIISITATGDFTQTNDCGTNLDSGAHCTISVTFKPTAAGARSGSLTITDSGVTGSSQSVSLSGTGIRPVANPPASGGSPSAPSPLGPGQAKD